MSKEAVFVQVQDKPGTVEVEIPIPASVNDIRHALTQADVKFDEDMDVFVDESEDPLKDDGTHVLESMKPGTHIHLSKCKKVKVTVHFQDKTIDRAFAPGTRVRTVKQWAVHELKINPIDAGEHVLRLCNSTKQPPTDTPLAELTDGRTCAVCFDLVPEKRVEG